MPFTTAPESRGPCRIGSLSAPCISRMISNNRSSACPASTLMIASCAVSTSPRRVLLACRASRIVAMTSLRAAMFLAVWSTMAAGDFRLPLLAELFVQLFEPASDAIVSDAKLLDRFAARGVGGGAGNLRAGGRQRRAFSRELESRDHHRHAAMRHVIEGALDVAKRGPGDGAGNATGQADAAQCGKQAEADAVPVRHSFGRNGPCSRHDAIPVLSRQVQSALGQLAGPSRSTCLNDPSRWMMVRKTSSRP